MPDAHRNQKAWTPGGVLAIVQARMGSTRLPGKALLPLAGKPALGWVLDRLSACERLDGLVVATTTDPSDDAIVEACAASRVDAFRGSPDDVLDRFASCARRYGPRAIVRVTGDCPVIDPEVVDACVALYLAQTDESAYASNCVERTYPDGLDVEVFSHRALIAASEHARLGSEREHVTPYVRAHGRPVHLRLVGRDLSRMRLTLDHPEDAEVLGALLGELGRADARFGLDEMVAWLEAHPAISSKNARFEVNEGLARSLAEDRAVRPAMATEGQR